jgi:hypothetical protein
MNRPTAIYLSVLALLLFCSCSPAPTANSNQQNGANTGGANASTTPNDNVEELRSSMQIPFEPEDAVWRVVSDKNGRKRLTAVLRLKPEDYKDLSAKASAAGPGRQVQASVDQWFPPELSAISETTGEMTVTGTSYPANEFFQPPFDSGTVTLINDTDYVIVELQSS